MGRGDLHEKDKNVIVKRDGKGSTAMSAPAIRHVMS
jgi:hypothetical protein